MKAHDLGTPNLRVEGNTPMPHDSKARSLKTRPASTATSKVDQVRALLSDIAEDLGLVPRHVSIQAFAKSLGFSPQHIYVLMKREGLPYKDLPGGRRIPVDEALAWLDQWRRP